MSNGNNLFLHQSFRSRSAVWIEVGDLSNTYCSVTKAFTKIIIIESCAVEGAAVVPNSWSW
jgi:hypothetical protein